VGGPIDSNYRDASIIHDWYCDRRTRTWQATHRVFYEAMIVSGVSIKKAKILYFAVRWRGPRWEERVSLNTKLKAPDRFDFMGRSFSSNDFLKELFTKEILSIGSPGESFSDEDQVKIFDERVSELEATDHSLDQLDVLADGLQRNVIDLSKK